MEWVKFVHLTCVVLSGSGFLLRSYWLLQDSVLSGHRLTKLLPHINDTLLLLSAIVLAYGYGLNPLLPSWLLAKIVALFFYIGFGLLAFRFAKNKQQRMLAIFLAVLTFAYIVQTAFTKNPWVF